MKGVVLGISIYLFIFKDLLRERGFQFAVVNRGAILGWEDMKIFLCVICGTGFFVLMSACK